MIKEALQYLVGLAPGERFTIEGREYSTAEFYPILEPTARTLELHSLTGLVDYIKSGGDLIVDKGDLFIHVLSPSQVFLHGVMDEIWKQRDTFLKVSLIDNSFRFGSWYEIEDFIIEMQAKFEIDDTVRLILGHLSRIEDGASKTIQDNGITQQVMTKSGITKLAMEQLPNPVTLKPYRTFSEAGQPESQFVLRLKSALSLRESDEGKPKVALFDAGGNKWIMESILAIKEWLKKELPDIAIIA